jgi:Cu2+-exporting ATPase
MSENRNKGKDKTDSHNQHQHKEKNHKKHDHDHDKGGHNKHKDSHDHSGHHSHMAKDFRKRFWISLVITLPIVVLSPMIQGLLGYELSFPGDSYIQFALSSAVFFYGGWPFLKGAFGEIRKKSPGMMTLIGLAIVVAYVYSSSVVFFIEGRVFFWELASLIDIMLLGHWFEMRSVMGASNALKELAELMPSTARKIDSDNNSREVPVSELKSDDIILVKPGEKIPADGEIIDGETHINESMISGESKPVSKKKGDSTIGGSLNDTGTIKIRVGHTGDDAYLSKVIGMVREAQESKSKTQNLANRAAAWLFYIALGSGIITLAVWLSLGNDFDYSLERMVTVLIISCPHALGLAVPLVAAISTSVSASNGLLIRNRTAFENSRKISVIIFDKTGTLTKGEFGVTRIQPTVKEVDSDLLIKLAASVESKSEHPIAAGICRKAEEEEIKTEEAEDFDYMKGKGVSARVGNKDIKVVSPGFLKENNIEIPEGSSTDKAETVVFVISDDDLIGYIALADEIREESADAVKSLKDSGIKVMMATGDNEEVAKSVSRNLKLDKYYSGVLPEDKQKIIKDLQSQGEVVAMTGDGVNDAPALAQADVGIAVGSGTDVAAETADIILVKSNPKDIAKLIFFGASTYRKMIQNLWWAAGYNIVAIPLAAGVLFWAGIILSPAIGAVLMSLSTIIVALNAQLLRKSMS